jgi:hypothetical protein
MQNIHKRSGRDINVNCFGREEASLPSRSPRRWGPNWFMRCKLRTVRFRTGSLLTYGACGLKARLDEDAVNRL